ncbi:MAG: hypothetical protein OXC82_00510 [Rhodobacteraceae bacterium]|nr:hypothetical protein [Paracoccaceae bacterium]MCY4248908.1 hypothetical protein [Paracoccaceae bacterium]
MKQPEFGVFALFWLDSFVFRFQVAETCRIMTFRGRSSPDGRKHRRKNDFGKGTIRLEVSEVLGDALAEFAELSEDIPESDHPRVHPETCLEGR